MPTPVLLPTYTIGPWSANVVDDSGCRWLVSTQTLTHGPGVKTHTSERPFGTGAYRARGFRTGRSDTLTGTCEGLSWATREQARNTLLGLFGTGDQMPLSIYNGLSTRTINVELNDITHVDVWADGLGFDWQLSLFAADPRFLDSAVQTAGATVVSTSTDGLDWATGGGLDWSTGGGLNWGTSGSTGLLSMTNSGTAPTWPVFRISGPMTNPTLTDPTTGNVIAYTGFVDVGQTLVIDCSPFTRTVNLNGIDRSGALSSAAWIQIPAGGTTVLQFSGSGAGSLTASWQSAYF
ncbi:tail protein [Amycolatopsis echigonensis]|uniref:Tail protein n=2 Tax=Amycolatopsis echigonensis TaxID=2576905 RepID=A0A2N3WPX5_9PSEU|nr:tail protein [Amycolatopsis niigatensis]